MRTLLLIALLVACRESRAPADKKKPTGSGSAVVNKDPWQAKDAGPVVPETPEAKQKRAEVALARVESIEPKLAKLRGLSFEHPVPAVYQTTDDFKAFLHREIAKDLPGEKSQQLSTAFFHLGLLQKPIDLATTLEATMATQAAAYYDPAAKKFFMVMVPDSDILLDTMSAHELTHGLQDQHFDLTKYMTTKPPLDDDAQIARRFVVEGDATFSMFVYMAADATKSDAVQDMTLKMLRGQIEQFAKMDLSAYSEMMKQQAASFKDMDPELKKSMDAIGELPPIVVGPLIDSYMKGALAVLTVYDQGSWDAVNKLFKDPPESSEQVLHPATKLFPKREHPKKVTLPKLDGEVVTTNVLGELQWSIYFSLWAPDKAAEASQGWGGDHYIVVKRADGLLGYHATIWDTLDDAKQFAAAYEASFEKRFPGGERKHAVKIDGLKVFVLDGSDDAKLLAQLVKGTKFS